MDLKQLLTARLAANDENLMPVISNAKAVENIYFQPKEGFVIKTKTTTTTDSFPSNTKVFINICHSESIPSGLAIEHQQELETAEFKISKLKCDLDLKGTVCLVVDFVINSFYYQKTNSDSLKLLIQKSIDLIQVEHGIILSPDYTLPKLKSKGKLSLQYIDRNPIQVIDQDPLYTVNTSLDKVDVTVDLPLLESINEISVDLTQDLLVLNYKKQILKIKLEKIDIDNSEAVFDWYNRKLLVTCILK